MPSVLPAAVLGAGALGLGGSALQAGAAKSAASTQAQAADTAANNTLSMFEQTKGLLSPFVSAGTGALAGLNAALPSLTSNWNPTPAALAATPGYEFNLQQGQQAVQNAFTPGGLGSGTVSGSGYSPSGPGLKGAEQYAVGLANTTWQNVGQFALAQRLQQFNMLYSPVQLGENAAAMTGQQGLSATQSANNFLTSGAAASAAGTVGSANAIAGGLSGVGSNALNYALLQNSGLFGGGAQTGAAGIDPLVNSTVNAGLPANA